MKPIMETTLMSYAQAVAYSDEKANKVPMASSDHSRATLWCLKTGQEIHPHVHEGDHIWVLMEGSGNYLDGKNRQPVKRGDVLFVPAGLPHGIENTAKDGLVFVSISVTGQGRRPHGKLQGS